MIHVAVPSLSFFWCVFKLSTPRQLIGSPRQTKPGFLFSREVRKKSAHGPPLPDKLVNFEQTACSKRT